jgi:hypothetical protein
MRTDRKCAAGTVLQWVECSFEPRRSKATTYGAFTTSVESSGFGMRRFGGRFEAVGIARRTPSALIWQPLTTRLLRVAQNKEDS